MLHIHVYTHGVHSTVCKMCVLSYIMFNCYCGCTHVIHSSAPDAPENFAVTVIDSSSVRTTWDNPLNSNGIILRFSLTLELFPGQGYLPRPETTSYPTLARSQFVLEITGLHRLLTMSSY